MGQPSDPHRDPHAEKAGKVQRVPGRKFALPARLFLSVLHDLLHKAAHGGCCLVLLLPCGVGVGAEGESGVIVPKHGGHRLYVYAVLEGCGGEGMPLRYNYDKPEKPRISRVFGYLARFFILFQTEKSSREVVIS